MIRSQILVVTLFAPMLLTVSSAGAQGSEEAAVRAAVNQYFRGHATASGEEMRKAFLPTAHIEGMRDGNWNYRGGARTTYPSAIGYGDGVASSGTTMFFDVTDQTGTVRKHWLNRVTRWTAPRLKLDAVWADHEIAALDVTRQVKASDGIIDGIYYVLEINQHRFGIGEPSETTLVPL